MMFAMLVAASLATGHPVPVPPVPVAPPDDPERHACVTPDTDGIRLTWTPAENPYPTQTYIEVRRYEPHRDEWREWVKQYVVASFTLKRTPRLYGASFAWRVWTVDPTGIAKPYATPSRWSIFCTTPEKVG